MHLTEVVYLVRINGGWVRCAVLIESLNVRPENTIHEVAPHLRAFRG